MNSKFPKKTLEPKYYFDQDIFELEMEKLFTNQLFAVAHSSELREAGQFKRITLLNEDVLLVRQTNNSIAAFANRCVHRGSTIETTDDGCKKRFTCPYHAWQFDLSGRLVSTRNLLPSLEKEIALPNFPLTDVGGLQLLSLDKVENEELSQLFQLKEYFDFYGLANTSVATKNQYRCKANWKLVTENFLECYHCAPNHPQLTIAEGHVELLEEGDISQFLANQKAYFSRAKALGHPVPAPQFITEESQIYAVSNGVHLSPPRETGSLSGKLVSSLLGKQTAVDHGFIYGSIGPFVHFSIYSDYCVVFSFTPISAEETNIEVFWLTNADFDFCNLTALTWLWHHTIQQDNQLCELVQQQVKSRYASSGYYTEMEADSAYFSAWYKRHFVNIAL